jgi:hypothetical protein
MVCSTFIWEAVQLANRRGGPQISLDGRPARFEKFAGKLLLDPCADLLQLYNGRKRISLSPQDRVDPQDGLYFYDENSRHLAAVALQAKLIAKVMDHVGSFLDDVAGPPLVGGILGGAGGVVIADLLGSNPLVLAVLLGVGTAYLDTQVRILRDTARHLSNQLGSTFQSDDSKEGNDSDDWQHAPGTGNTVSPDDTVNNWAAPYFESADEVVGLYGFSQRVEVLSPAPIEGPVKLSTWEVAPAFTQSKLPPHQGVRVFFKNESGVQTFLSGARAQVGCFEMVTAAQSDMTKPQTFSGQFPLGQYYARAGWQDSQGFQWKGPRVIVTIPGPSLDLEVFPPKQTRRAVRISGTSDLLNRHATDGIPVVGTDPWERNGVNFDSGSFPMGLDLAQVDSKDDPEFLVWLKDNYPTELKEGSKHTYVWQEDIENWGVARASFVFELLTTGALVVTVTGGTKKKGDDIQWGDPQPGVTVVPKLHNTDGPHKFDFKIERVGPGFPPVRATLHIQVDNNQQGG